jgi:hypothetical protein
MINFIVSHFISANYTNSNKIFGTLVGQVPFYGTGPFSPFINEERDYPSSPKKGPVPFFSFSWLVDVPYCPVFRFTNNKQRIKIELI